MYLRYTSEELRQKKRQLKQIRAPLREASKAQRLQEYEEASTSDCGDKHPPRGIQLVNDDVVARGLSGKVLSSGAIHTCAKISEDAEPVPVSPLFFVDGFPSLPSLLQQKIPRPLAAFRCVCIHVYQSLSE
jgi:hypothetical protein